MSAILAQVLALLAQIVPVVGEASAVSKIVSLLVSILPPLIQEAKDLVTPVKNIIAALSANPATTADQLAQLQALDAQCDAAFDDAAAAAQAEDGTVPATPTDPAPPAAS